ncbi:NADH-quinone oxidoreductase subunit NuoI [Buchnera aphidicola]|uniref:NADH-quinone oxidoreductase subunit I n=1 Tax=Buchnera aphidicola (Anoecia oenotherae) TaxID=1241833 RepID=A0A4D6XXR4_9GAMM|nr:NADH-quinone oxidoreductase subunit NuoI [Buchnera aphidicola]QCI19264.1 NADH-quinone oxidoreductase subunit NuoI [Buchnera aphidicola (Anoecia oenotherae)]
MFIKKILFFLLSQLRSLLLILFHLFKKPETQNYPEDTVNLSQRYRGRIILTRDPNGKERCVACNLCAVVCPVGCISLQKTEKKNRWYPKFFRINFSRCIFCGLCEEACPTTAIQLIPDFELAEYDRKDLIYEKENLLISGTGKNKHYNFYNVSGVQLHEEKEYSSQHSKKKTCVDIHSLLP